jgi:hypothetical protein
MHDTISTIIVFGGIAGTIGFCWLIYHLLTAKNEEL